MYNQDQRTIVLSRWAGNESRSQDKSFGAAILDILNFHRNTIGPNIKQETIQALRDIEAGAVIYDPDDSRRALAPYTYIDNADQLHLRDSGYILLYALDCNIEAIASELGALGLGSYCVA